MTITQKFFRLKNIVRTYKQIDQQLEVLAILEAQNLYRDYIGKHVSDFSEVEFKVFSQWGDDGIIQWLINNLDIKQKTYIEFGVEDYKEANTRFLLMNNNWSGLVLDASSKNIRAIKDSYYFWKYDLEAINAFISAENINSLIPDRFKYPNPGLLHIDLDGNDYWIWKELKFQPDIVIMEYNSLFGQDRAITIPYNKSFNRTNAHYSNLYFGASLKALLILAKFKGYSFIGSNSAGNNAYFVKKELLNNLVKEKSLREGYVISKFRESRDQQGNLTYLNRDEALNLIGGMPVYDIEADTLIKL